MSGKTTITVERRPTKLRLDRRLLDLKDRAADGERVSMDDVITDLLDRTEELERLRADDEGEPEEIANA